MTSSPGIQPIRQPMIFGLVFLANFALTGSGDSYANCGAWFTMGCLNVAAHHNRNTLEGAHPDWEGAAYLQRMRHTCHRAVCPVCWESWANREKDRAVQRFDAFKTKSKIVHYMISVPKEDYGLSLPDMRRKVYKNLKSVHVWGGMLIYHPKRKNSLKEWYFSPHFHVLGYGWLLDIRKNYNASGYVVKNLGVRKNVPGTIYYQLSHCGISEKYQTITWFGALSYSKLKVEIKNPDPQVCPICFEPLREVLWIGEGPMPIPDVEGSGFLDDPGGWMYVPAAKNSDDCSTELGDVY